MKFEAQAERDRREFKLERSRLEHEFRMRRTQNKVVEMQIGDRIVRMADRQE